MGVVNCTPDSFSDGMKDEGINSQRSIAKSLSLLSQGAHVLDIGGESTRPGAKEVSVEEELRRVIPVIEGIRRQSEIPISIDTRKAVVAWQALKAGASIINDVSGFTFDPAMQAVISEFKPTVIVTHSRGTPATMQFPPHTTYRDVLSEIISELRQRCEMLESCGLEAQQIYIDPGFGFAKTPAHSWELLDQLERLHVLPYPALISLSRKGFLGDASGERDPARRDPETLAALAIAYRKGFRFFRVHDVALCRKFFAVVVRS